MLRHENVRALPGKEKAAVQVKFFVTVTKVGVRDSKALVTDVVRGNS